MKKINNIHYEFTNSYNDKLKEVAVNYTLNGVPHRYFIFLQKKGKENDKYYLNEAKKKFNEDYKSGKVIRSTKLDHSKPILIALTCIFGATTIALGSFLGYLYATGAFNKGGGDEPEPTVWQDSTKEEVNGIVSEILTKQATQNPLNAIKEKYQATQFKITDFEEDTYFESKTPSNEGDLDSKYYIDTDKLYIGNVYYNKTKKEYEKSYCSFQSTPVSPKNGVYTCSTDSEGKKVAFLEYEAATVAKAQETFNPSNSSANIQDWVSDVYQSEKYEFEDGTDLIDFVWSYYHTLDQTGIAEEDYPEMTYQKADNLSFKITCDKTGKLEGEGYSYNLIYKLNFLVEDGVFKSCDSEFTIEDMLTMKRGTTIETTSFTPDDLSDYFKK